MRNVFQVIALTCLISLTGCGVATMSKALQLSRQGDCAGAEAEYRNDPLFQQAPGKQALYIGFLYSGCYKQPDAARAYFTLAARHGEQFAPDILRKMGAPVPPVDLSPGRRPYTVMDGMRDAASGIQTQRLARPTLSPEAPTRAALVPPSPTAPFARTTPISPSAPPIVAAPIPMQSPNVASGPRGESGVMIGDTLHRADGVTVRQEVSRPTAMA